MHTISHTIHGLLRAYGAILLAEKPWVGGIFVLATLWFPNTGLAGLLAASTGMAVAALMKFRHLDSGLHVYNSLLVGLSLGAYYQLDMYLAVLIMLGAVLAVFVTVAMSDALWRLGRLPVLSLPFVIVALMATLAAHSYGTLSRYLLPMAPHDTFLSAWVDQFLTALGSAFFIPHPMAGLLLFVGVLLTSRYLAALAVSGFAVGFATYTFLSGNPNLDLVAWNGFNFILVTMVLGGVFTVPSMASFTLAVLASALTALLTASMETLMLVYGLPVMAVPFLLTTMTILLALGQRPASASLQLLLHQPALPEVSKERARLAEVRLGEYGSIPVMAPFYGQWSVYQGFNGEHTHQGLWQHALDFYITEQGQSYRSDGAQLDDYYCFGLPVLSPVNGYVVQALHTLPDNAPGQMDTENNWGNFVLIRMPNGLYVLLAHLMHHSVTVSVGSYVYAGQTLAQCGSSGRSPQPHLHLHVQTAEALGSPTHPFHLTSVLHRPAAQNQARFTLFTRPQIHDAIVAAKLDAALVNALNMPVGQAWHYEVTINGEVTQRQCYVDINLQGELFWCSDRGARARFTQEHGILAYFERNDVADVFLDSWLLALGLTPLNEGELQWQDRPASNLLPLTAQQRLLRHLIQPLGGGLHSHYHRHARQGGWLQQGEHQLHLPWGQCISATTCAELVPHTGCESLQLNCDAVSLHAKLLKISQREDAGIPSWQVDVTFDSTSSGSQV